MPIYEFYCPDCHMIFSFFSKKIDTQTRPSCPRCRGKKLQREVSRFAMTGRAEEKDSLDDLPIDESKMEATLESLAGAAENIDENDPRAAAGLMRKFAHMTRLEFNEGMQNALERMEAGEDPDVIEKEMGDVLENEEDPFVLPGSKSPPAGSGRRRHREPGRDPKLYDM